MENLNTVKQKINNNLYISKTPTKRRSSVWKIYREIHDLENTIKPFVLCKKCEQVLSYNKKNGTTNLTRHKCFVLFQGSSEEVFIEPKRKKVVPPEIKENSLKLAVQMCAYDLRPFEIVDGKGFQNFIKFTLDTGAKLGSKNIDIKDFLPHSTTVSKHTKDIATEKREEIINEIKHYIEDGICTATTDIWTDPFKQQSYITLTVHFIDKFWKLQSYVLFTVNFQNEKKTSEVIKRKIIEKFKELGLENFELQNLRYVTDQGSNIVAALDNCTRINCSAHLLHNTLKDAFTDVPQEVNNLLLAAKSLVRFMKKNGDVNKLQTTLIQECDTRWNTKLLMLLSIEKHYSDIVTLYSNTNNIHRITNINLKLLQEIVKFLTPFKHATDLLEAEKVLTVHRIVLEIKKLKNFLLDLNLGFTTTLSELSTEENIIHIISEKALESLKKRFKENLYFNTAVFLWPNFRQLKMLTEVQKESTLSFIYTKLKYYQRNDSLLSTSTTSTKSVSSNDYDEDNYDYWKDDPFTVNQEESYKQELQNYLNMPFTGENILQFYKDNEHKLPTLAKLAREVLAIPASSSPSERTFSIAGNILQEKRTNLKAENLDSLLFLHGQRSRSL